MFDKKYYFQVFKVLQTYEKKQLYKFLILSLITVILETISIGALIPITTLFIEGSNSNSNIIEYIDPLREILNISNIYYFLLFIVIFIFVLKNIYLVFFIYWQQSLIKQITVNLSKRLMNYYIHENYSFHINKNSSELFRNLTTGVNSFSSSITYTMSFLTECLIFIFLLILLLFIQTKVILIILIVFGLPTMVIGYVIKVIVTKYGEQIVFFSGKSLKNLLQALNSFKEIKIFGKEKLFLKAYIYNENQVQEIQKKSSFIKYLPKLIFEILLMVTIFGVFMFSYKDGGSVTSALSAMSITAIVSIRIIPSITKILFSLNSLKRNQAFVKIIENDLMNSQKIYSEIKPKPNKEYLFKKNIQFKNIQFNYENPNVDIFKDLNLQINKGDYIGIYGKSGSGKSTLIDIFLGLQKLGKGKILIDNQELVLHNNKDWQSIIGYVSQTIVMLDDTIQKNITFEDDLSKIDEKRYEECIQKVELKDFISELKSGSDTIIAEGGSKLSGGQRQRIGIARALYINPEIIILDESTNSLDSNTEKNLIRNLEKYIGEKTIISISHNPSVIKNCNKIFEIVDGKLETIK